jgi:uncharacterized Zn finger protein (UPF0148 family)
MLSTSCPLCNTALMSKEGRFHCPGCDVPVMTAESAATIRLSSNSATTSANASQSQDLTQSKAPALGSTEGVVKSLEEEKKAYDTINRRRIDDVSSKIGLYLLQGYKLLSEECPDISCKRTPLMQQKSDRPFCVCCGKSFHRDTYGALSADDDVSSSTMAQSSGVSLTNVSSLPSEGNCIGRRIQELPVLRL